MNSLYALVSLWAVLAGPELKWGDHYGKARNQAVANGRPLLVVIETDRSRQADAVPESPYQNASGTVLSASRELLAKYELCRVDGDTEYGQRVARAFKARQLPMTAIIDKTGEWTVFVKSGEISSNQLNDALAEWQDGVASAQFVANIIERQRERATLSLESQARVCRT